jgi:hypothetical protein
MTGMARKVLRARGSHRLVLPFRQPGAAGKAMASGGLLPTGPGPRGTMTFDEWLAASGPAGSKAAGRSGVTGSTAVAGR